MYADTTDHQGFADQCRGCQSENPSALARPFAVPFSGARVMASVLPREIDSNGMTDRGIVKLDARVDVVVPPTVLDTNTILALAHQLP